MGDIRREMERLRPIYETGVLRLLLRQHAMLYVALLRAAFDPLTGELPRETVEERFAQSLQLLEKTGDYVLHDQSYGDAAHRILTDLTREGEGDYAWLANSHDAASHRFLYRLTARAHRAIEALSRLEDQSSALSGAQANSIIMEIEHARMQLTADPGERVRLLNKEIKERQHEIRRIQHGQQHATLNRSQVEDIIAVIHNTLRGVPIDLRELVLTERDNGDALRRRMQAGAMSVDDTLNRYHEDYRRSFRESDAGRRFEDAFQVIITDEGRRQIDSALRDIAKTPYLAGDSATLLGQIRDELARIYVGLEAVRNQMRVSDEAISRLVRQQTDTRYRTMMNRLNRLYVSLNASAQAHMGDASRPYATDTANALFAPLPMRPARSMTHTATPKLSGGPSAPDTDMVSLKDMVTSGGPRLRHMIDLIRRNPVIQDGLVDVAASFNRLPERERRESELVGFLGGLPSAAKGNVDDGPAMDATWHCIALDGSDRDWHTIPLWATLEELDAIAEEEQA
ncbi:MULTISPECIES: DUF3375 domain-containing protein [Bifidobacterium]|uniref:Methyl-accepting chemotaxis protein n=1 Tax=Bifidobacterium reuteri DSM 23975 TaxID=1437610 RepID=A0A087CUT2_9BIFI|nr:MULTISPECIES: DUF3375 domain-containing protein [Bifidobacterium]KFI87032.1 Methyl-accepting chemotaxis protein [Bifidobacterium reuteri DSM 23975]TPF80587.1 hypothetical protein BW08_03990 [Bifidobacterium sp. UTCIF-24]TPF89644.1 hypothetical protein BW10_06100 [Bifidobacterium sp. UTBIF-56]TPF93833.1 hypothetical protein BW14_03775 [Bifidobacterium sp. UTBIF-68]